MPNKKSDALTPRQQAWLNHLHRCMAQGKTLAAYAQAEGLDLKALYNWRYRLGKKGVLPVPPDRPGSPQPRFQRVVLNPPPPGPGQVRLRWPNGRLMEIDSGVDPGYVKRLLEGLGVAV